MKARIIVGALSALSLAGLLYYPAAAQSMGNTDNFGFGKQIAGTYFSNAGFGGTVTLHADGTVVALSGQCCGNAPNVQSESYGNWVRTGPKQIKLSTVAIGTSWDPTSGTTVRTGNFIATPSQVLDFAADFQSFTGELCTRVWFFPLGAGVMPDILDPLVLPDLTVGPFPVASTRLPVDVICP